MDAFRRLSLAALAAFAGCQLAAAQEFEIPEGFISEVVREQGADGEPRAILRVGPESGAFSELSTIELEPLSGEVDDPAAWLRARMTAGIADIAPDPDAMIDNPDSPFGDPAFDELRAAVAALMARLAELGRLPLEYCEGPEARDTPAGALHELSCRFTLGPVNQYLVLRLQNVDGLWYYTRIRTMNERRLRHLLAIANSFHVD